MRGWVELAINDSYWLGAAFGAAITPILLNPDSSTPTSAGGSRSRSAP